MYLKIPDTLWNVPISKLFSEFTFRNSEYKDLSSKYFFLTSNKSAHSVKICLTVIVVLHTTHTGRSKKGMREIAMTNNHVVCLELCLLFMYYKMLTICLKALVRCHEACWILRWLHPILSARLDVYIWQSRVFGLKRASGHLSAASFPRTSTGPGTHIKTTSFWTTLILCTIFCICVNRG